MVQNKKNQETNEYEQKVSWPPIVLGLFGLTGLVTIAGALVTDTVHERRVLRFNELCTPQVISTGETYTQPLEVSERMVLPTGVGVECQGDDLYSIGGVAGYLDEAALQGYGMHYTTHYNDRSSESFVDLDNDGEVDSVTSYRSSLGMRIQSEPTEAQRERFEEALNHYWYWRNP